jgi:two-component system cell cycle response regulator
MESKGLKLLIIDESPAFHEVYRKAVELVLSVSGLKITCLSAFSGTDGFSKIDQWNPDIVLIDTNAPGKSAIEICKTLRHRQLNDKYLAIVFLSHDDDPSTIEKCLDAGGDEFCTKGNAAHELPSRLRCALRVKHMHEAILKSNRELIEANRKLTRLSEMDELTGLLNMRSFKSRMMSEFSRSQRHGLMMSIIMLDLDHFKNVNDSSNHLVGSFVLAEVGKIIKNTIRKHDVAARFGGDEYVVMLPHTGESGAWKTANNIEDAIANAAFRMDHFEARVTVSIGIEAFIPKLSLYTDAIEVMKVADQNLYKSKAHGRACIFSSTKHSEPIIDYSQKENLVRCISTKKAS